MTRKTLRTTAELIAWMEGEYLSEALLRRATPKPTAKRAPRSVRLVLGLVVPEDPPQLQQYTLEAHGVTRWTLDGEWDVDTPLSFPDVELPDAPVAIVIDAPGRIVLTASHVEVERGATTKYRPPPRPRSDELLVWGPREISWRDVLAAVGAPASTRIVCVRHRGGVLHEQEVEGDALDARFVAPLFDRFELRTASGEPWASIHHMLAIGRTGFYLSITRAPGADDDRWARARRAPIELGECEVMSGSVRTTSSEWARWLQRSAGSSPT
ncbi:hypothetical protein [Sandaracinus amylolyticus]|uniref:Uncharacterized protein n=1 Tax=Sandaracinus amylolyticus TaxID=927083 RepID=A0A0F6YN44_9BACT|nr:hypothetical protein [Sandaracinus amylolyticus]AKF11497.1 hypothetical protein DB32_008646 [Sandaracinus amylolyticus]